MALKGANYIVKEDEGVSISEYSSCSHKPSSSNRSYNNTNYEQAYLFLDQKLSLVSNNYSLTSASKERGCKAKFFSKNL